MKYRDWFICQYSFSFYLLQAIGEDKMNAVEILLKNGEDAMSKSPTTWPKAKIMVHDNEGGRLIISESYKITICTVLLCISMSPFILNFIVQYFFLQGCWEMRLAFNNEDSRRS